MLNLVLVRICKRGYSKGGGSNEGSNTFMYKSNYKGIEKKLVLSKVGW